MNIRPAARVARIAWRVLWEKPPTLHWPPRPPVHEVIITDETSGQVYPTVLPHDTMTITVDPKRLDRPHKITVKCV